MALDKVKTQFAFVDLSDYARPLARIATRLLVPTRISPVHVTLAFTAVGFTSGTLLATGDLTLARVAGCLLIIKSFLDAIDGSLARARNRPSRVGRFLDSLCDYLVNAIVLAGIAWPIAQQAQSAWPLIVAVLALELMTWHGTTFNYYYVTYRHLTAGDTTSQAHETADTVYPWDNPATLRVVFRLYGIIYAWQDRWMAVVDRHVTGTTNQAAYYDKRLLTLTTAFGLGFQLLLFAILCWIGRPGWIFWLIIGPYNIYWIYLMLYRWRRSK